VAGAVEVLKGIGEYAGRRGLRVSLDEGRGAIVVEHAEYPVKIVIEPAGSGVYLIELRAGEDIGEAVESLLQDNVDPRAELESAIETLLEVVDYAVRRLSDAGYGVEKRTREAILDVYDAIESFLEEEE